jgi:ATP-dependent RNA helicase DDX19/DBP5
MSGWCTTLQHTLLSNKNPSGDMQIMPSAHKVFVEKEQLSLDVIKQYRVDVSDITQKDAVLQEYILKNADRLGQTIIFVASRRTAQSLYQVP